ncbi:MAG: thioesterase family protein [Anaerovoracaceae bacterium]
MLELGIKGKESVVVNDGNTAKSMGSGALNVFATPAMIALMELTTWRSLEEHLEEGDGTVGTAISMKHIAATPLGKEVSCESELIEMDGRRLLFKVTAYDESGVVGEGTHERFVVNKEKFQKKVESKFEK